MRHSGCHCVYTKTKQTEENPARVSPCLESQHKDIGDRVLDSGLGKNCHYWWILIARALADFLRVAN